MRICAVFIPLALFVSANTVQAYTIVIRDDLEAFLALAGDVREIDFETLPDGTSSRSGIIEITPEFNYTDQGVSFAAPYPTLRITPGNDGGFALWAVATPSSDPNWIIAHFTTPVTAVGLYSRAGGTLTLRDASSDLIAHESLGNASFLGIIADEPITVAIQNEGRSGAFMDSFFFVPVPEPASLLLLAIGGGAVLFLSALGACFPPYEGGIKGGLLLASNGIQTATTPCPSLTKEARTASTLSPYSQMPSD